MTDCSLIFSLFRKIVGLLHSQLVFELILFKLTWKLLPFIVIFVWLLYLLLGIFSKFFINFKLIEKFRSLVSMISETLLANNWRSDWIFHWCSCIVSDIKSGFLLKRLANVSFSSFWRFILGRDSCLFVLIETLKYSLDLLIDFVYVINPVFFNRLIVRVIEPRSGSGLLLSGVKSGSLHLCGFTWIFTIK